GGGQYPDGCHARSQRRDAPGRGYGKFLETPLYRCRADRRGQESSRQGDVLPDRLFETYGNRGRRDIRVPALTAEPPLLGEHHGGGWPGIRYGRGR
ncbi:MAG: hypothetical protein ACLUZR_14290, partial [Odoribacter laneus]|uniref:hypothetical protein n=1 Tax=Odoribacter laneus TaxID=626933 RepID=UPI00399BE22F